MTLGANNEVIKEVVDKLESSSSDNRSYLDSDSIASDNEGASNNDVDSDSEASSDNEVGSDIVPQDLEDSQLTCKLSDLQSLYAKQSLNIGALELTEINRL